MPGCQAVHAGEDGKPVACSNRRTTARECGVLMWRPPSWKEKSFLDKQGVARTKKMWGNADADERIEVSWEQCKSWIQRLHRKGGRGGCDEFTPPKDQRRCLDRVHLDRQALTLAGTSFCVDHFPPGSFHKRWDGKTHPGTNCIVFGSTPALRIVPVRPAAPVTRTGTLRSAGPATPTTRPLPLRKSPATVDLRSPNLLKRPAPVHASPQFPARPAPGEHVVYNYELASQQRVRERAGKRLAVAEDKVAAKNRATRERLRHTINDRQDCSAECLADRPMLGEGLDEPCHSCQPVLSEAALQKLPAHALKSLVGCRTVDQLKVLYDLVDVAGDLSEDQLTCCQHRKTVDFRFAKDTLFDGPPPNVTVADADATTTTAATTAATAGSTGGAEVGTNAATSTTTTTTSPAAVGSKSKGKRVKHEGKHTKPPLRPKPAAFKAPATAPSSLNTAFKPKPVTKASLLHVHTKEPSKPTRKCEARPGRRHKHSNWRCLLFVMLALHSGNPTWTCAALMGISVHDVSRTFSSFVMILYV